MRGMLAAVAMIAMLGGAVRAETPVPVRTAQSAPDQPAETSKPLDARDFMVVDPDRGRRRIGVMLVVGGGMLMLASLLVSGLAVQDYYQARQRGDLEGARDASDVVSIYGTGLFMGGVAGVAVGAYRIWTARDPEVARRKLALVPVVDRDGFGVSLSRGF